MLVPFTRTIILYSLIIIAVRFMGKRQIGEMQPTELVVTILISAVASVPMQDINIPLTHGVVPILTLIAAEVIISTLSLKSTRFRHTLTGLPVPIIRDGTLDQPALKKLRLSIDDVFEDLRLNSVFDMRQVKYAQVETNGRMSLLVDTASSPVTPKMLSLTPDGAEPFHVIISDGYVSKSNLRQIGKDEAWMSKIIKAHGAVNASDVFVLCGDKSGNIIFCKKEKP